ncbi:SigE family RNA polymerase sigma factor [Nocardioides panaciterrulae]|uniref:RNA polymerase sigma-70 factor (Sigma-E family) n=1 Tax=Nocardioides panaciterrulae TaxID=661492 RepID=A0A7Y9E9W7_9ACTN|nr:RNA polymerase sigma-70 factor (sigma-E family) [Nocardioides panaciterrulae]
MNGETTTRPLHLVASYEEFVAARADALHRSAYLLVGNAADADDLLQTTLVKLYVAWSRASAADSVEAYARRVMVNALISARKPARWRRERPMGSVPEAGRSDPDPLDRIDTWPLVVALPPRQRAVIVLRYYEGLSEKEIADALGCAPGTVKSTASAALRVLRARMEEQE